MQNPRSAPPRLPMWIRARRLAYMLMVTAGIMTPLLIVIDAITEYPMNWWGYIRGAVVGLAATGYWVGTRRRAAVVEALQDTAYRVHTEVTP